MSTHLQYAGSALSVFWSTIKYASYFYVINTYVIPVKLLQHSQYFYLFFNFIHFKGKIGNM